MQRCIWILCSIPQKAKIREIEITENDIRHIAGHIKYVREKLMDSDGYNLKRVIMKVTDKALQKILKILRRSGRFCKGAYV